MPSIPSVEAIEPVVMIPGEAFLATADLRPLLPQSAIGALLESIVSVESIEVSPDGLGIDGDSAAAALFDSSTISFWLDAAAAAHGRRFVILVTFETQGASGENRTRKAICPVLIRGKDLP